MSTPKVSIIILNYNGSKDTIECLSSLENQTYKNFEVILVDNGSEETDFNKLKKFVKKCNLDLRLIRFEKNKGFTGGNNIGVKYSRGEYIVCLNNDTVVESDWLENLVKPLLRNKGKLAAVGSLLKNYYECERIEYSGGKINIFGQAKAFTKPESRYKKVFTLPGASYIIKKEVLREMDHLFCPEYFPIYYEEIDLSWRLYNLGYEMLLAPSSIVYHKTSITTKRKDLKAKTQISQVRNKYLTFYRNLPHSKFILVFILLISFDLLVAISAFFLLRRFDILKIKIKGIVEFFKNVRKVKHIGNGDFSYLDKKIYLDKLG